MEVEQGVVVTEDGRSFGSGEICATHAFTKIVECAGAGFFLISVGRKGKSGSVGKNGEPPSCSCIRCEIADSHHLVEVVYAPHGRFCLARDWAEIPPCSVHIAVAL